MSEKSQEHSAAVEPTDAKVVLSNPPVALQLNRVLRGATL